MSQISRRDEREHPVAVTGFPGDLQALGVEIGRMRYDAIVAVLDALATELARQAEADRHRERPALAQHLAAAAGEVRKSGDTLNAAWRLSRRYIPHELAKTPEIAR